MGRSWSDADRELLVALKDTIPNLTWKKIGWKFGRSPGACCTQYYLRKRGKDRRDSTKNRVVPRRYFPSD